MLQVWWTGFGYTISVRIAFSNFAFQPVRNKKIHSGEKLTIYAQG